MCEIEMAKEKHPDFFGEDSFWEYYKADARRRDLLYWAFGSQARRDLNYCWFAEIKSRLGNKIEDGSFLKSHHYCFEKRSFLPSENQEGLGVLIERIKTPGRDYVHLSLRVLNTGREVAYAYPNVDGRFDDSLSSPSKFLEWKARIHFEKRERSLKIQSRLIFWCGAILGGASLIRWIFWPF